MKSRYDFLQEGQVLDIDQQTYPDPLTINYNNGSLTKLPTEYRITSRDLSKWWIFMWEQYQMNEMDDVFLNINGVKYVMDMKPNDVIYKIVPEDIEGYLKNKKAGYDD
jgi:hypothetical protein